MFRTSHFLLVLALALSACAPVEQEPRYQAAPDEVLIWPPPPALARLRFLYAFHEPADLGFRLSFFEGLWQALAGKEQRGMVRPYAVAVADGVIAVADPGLRVLHLYNTRAQTYRRIAEVAKEALVSPIGVSFGPGNIYLADSILGKVFILDRNGDYLGEITGLERPTGIAFHRGSQRLYVADTLGHRIAVFDAAGASLATFGSRGGGDAEFNYPSHLAFHDDVLYVNDTMNFRLQAFSLDGEFRSSFGRLGDGSGDFAQPKGIGAAPAGQIFVVDALFNRIQVFDPEGRFLLALGGEGNQAGQFWLPAGLFIAGDRLFVADSYNQRIQVFQLLEGEL